MKKTVKIINYQFSIVNYQFLIAKFLLMWYNAYKIYRKKEVSQCTVFLSQMMTIIRA